MKKLLLLLFILIVSIISQAQTGTGKIKGMVKDGGQKVIESATISLLNAKDSSVVKMAVAGKSGAFEFESIPFNKYLLSVTAVGYQKGYSSHFELSTSEPVIEVKTIELAPLTKSVAGVTVVARRPLIEQRIDRMVVNVEASVTNVGNSALEVLEKSPGISVDREGNISLKGKQGVVVLVDGRPTQLGGADLANLLRSMNASQLDQIEIMTNPPAKYDAAGNAGIINIKTKKNQLMGYNGTAGVSYGQGRYPKLNESLNLNYRRGKFNVFTNLNHSYRKGFNNLDIQRSFRDRNSKEVVKYFDQEARMTNEFNSYNAKLGLDYFASKNTTYGVVLSGFSNPGTFQSLNHILISNPGDILMSQAKALSVSDRKWQNFSTNINFRQILDTTGKELTVDLDYIFYDGKTDQTLNNYYFDAVGNKTEKGDTLLGSLPQEINIYSGRIDYTHPLKKGARFEAGLKSSIVKTDNNAGYDSIQYGRLVHDFNRSNYFIYHENINAAYANLSGPLGKKWNGQLGLRMENTNAKGEQVTTGETFNRHYTQLFPTAFIQYKMDKNNTWGINYGRRIRRPNYESLNPFIMFIDRYTFQQGNPNLKPQFSHNIEFSHSYKGYLTTTLNYTRTNDIIQQVIQQNTERNETYVKQANIANQRQYGLSVSANMPITKWWTNSIYVNGFNNRFEGMVDSTWIVVGANTVMLNGSQQFKLGKNTTAEINGFFRTASIEGVIRSKPFGMLGLGLSQQVLKGKGTLRLNIRDVLYSQNFRGVAKYGIVDASFQERGDSRVVNVGFTYRFSKGKINGGPKRRAGSAGDEQSRVGGGQQ